MRLGAHQEQIMASEATMRTLAFKWKWEVNGECGQGKSDSHLYPKMSTAVIPGWKNLGFFPRMLLFPIYSHFHIHFLSPPPLQLFLSKGDPYHFPNQKLLKSFRALKYLKNGSKYCLYLFVCLFLSFSLYRVPFSSKHFSKKRKTV